MLHICVILFPYSVLRKLVSQIKFYAQKALNVIKLPSKHNHASFLCLSELISCSCSLRVRYKIQTVSNWKMF